MDTGEWKPVTPKRQRQRKPVISPTKPNSQQRTRLARSVTSQLAGNKPGAPAPLPSSAPVLPTNNPTTPFSLSHQAIFDLLKAKWLAASNYRQPDAEHKEVMSTIARWMSLAAESAVLKGVDPYEAAVQAFQGKIGAEYMKRASKALREMQLSAKDLKHG